MSKSAGAVILVCTIMNPVLATEGSGKEAVSTEQVRYLMRSSLLKEGVSDLSKAEEVFDDLMAGRPEPVLKPGLQEALKALGRRRLRGRIQELASAYLSYRCLRSSCNREALGSARSRLVDLTGVESVDKIERDLDSRTCLESRMLPIFWAKMIARNHRLRKFWYQDADEALSKVMKETTSVAKTPSDVSTRGVWSLTEPDLEPTYPVPGRQVPPHLLPEQIKRRSPTVSAGASVGDSIGLLKARKLEPLSSNARKLTQAYRIYVRDSQESAPSRRANRAALVKLVGPELVQELDRELTLEPK